MWYKIAQQIHEQHRRDYTAWDSALFDTLSDEEQDKYLSEMNRKRRAWDDSIQRSLSLGLTSPSEAKEKGYVAMIGGEEIKSLPDTLFHVTTAKSAVIQDSLKTRNELKQDFGKGLGGGTSDTLSFTEDINTATGIYKAMLEARKVASGEITARDMVDAAISGEGSEKSWIDDIKRYKKIKTDKDLEQFVNNLDGNYTLEMSYFPKTIEEFNEKDEEHKGQWKPVLSSKWPHSADEIDRYMQFVRPATVDEQRDRVFNFYKTWSTFREESGGPLNPLFFLTDVMGLASVPEEEIAILEFKPRPGAQGFQVSALGEWRTWSGNAVEFVREIK